MLLTMLNNNDSDPTSKGLILKGVSHCGKHVTKIISFKCSNVTFLFRIYACRLIDQDHHILSFGARPSRHIFHKNAVTMMRSRFGNISASLALCTGNQPMDCQHKRPIITNFVLLFLCLTGYSTDSQHAADLAHLDQANATFCLKPIVEL